jgi:hypothetical protein
MESLFGMKIFTKVEDKLYPTLISKNTKPEEKPYRITWFYNDKEPIIHADLDYGELSYIIINRKLPLKIQVKFQPDIRDVELIFKSSL